MQLLTVVHTPGLYSWRRFPTRKHIISNTCHRPLWEALRSQQENRFHSVSLRPGNKAGRSSPLGVRSSPQNQTYYSVYWKRSCNMYIYFTICLRFIGKLLSRISPIILSAVIHTNSRAGNSLIGFLSNSLFFAKKWANDQITQKNKPFDHSLIFGEGPQRIANGRLFLVSDLCD